MKRLRFRFQRLLEIKERLEGVRQRAMGEAMAAFTQEQENLEALHQTRLRYRRAAQEQPARAVDLGMLLLNLSYDQRLQREILTQDQRTQQAAARVEEERQRLVAARRERRTYEILKEKAAAEHRRLAHRQEQRQMDEVGEQGHRRRALAGES
ncbi:MAG: flagellar export protein FliJ [Candidatus Latescibacteria bacterium]|nr:flagellar export protein FliJ [Candidatus Latescibacterota bacterium]